jgi:hypothetical protein
VAIQRQVHRLALDESLNALPLIRRAGTEGSRGRTDTGTDLDLQGLRHASRQTHRHRLLALVTMNNASKTGQTFIIHS